MRAGQQPLDHRPHGGGAEHQRFLARAAIEHAVGEDMPALEIGAELHFVDGEESDIEVARHGFDGGDPVAWILRLDLLFAGDQRDRFRADALDHLVIDLASEKPQRQADHAGGMRHHPLDRQVRLPGIGGAENGGDAGSPRARVAGGRGRKGDSHRGSGLTEGHHALRASGVRETASVW
jgi:hypothetical protein